MSSPSPIAGGDCFQDTEAVIACLGDDAAALRNENPDDERAANMDRAAELLTALSTDTTSIEVDDAMALTFHRATTDGMIGSDELEDIKLGLRAVLCNLVAPTLPLSVTPVHAGLNLLAKKHEDMRVDYSGLLGECQRALSARRESANAEMLRQLKGHLKELGRRWYAGDIAVVDELLQLYCIESDARAALATSIAAKAEPAPCTRGDGITRVGTPAQGGLAAQLTTAVVSIESGHDPYCMSVLRGKTCDCGTAIAVKPDHDPYCMSVQGKHCDCGAAHRQTKSEESPS
ncbi:hypothetical protein ACSFA0_23405 [Variovorax sp. LT1P1]|uniref:hypothetical protein n=1 Tax=Variovorax sp. LT1P1 TaxID=3443730 RepID=UPI003F4545B2